VSSFEDLIAEGESVPVEGWDFSWFEGRATEERPPWGYARLLGARLAALAGVPGAAALDLQTGGGEVLATALAMGPGAPPTLAVTESWPPNVAVARRNLARFGAQVVAPPDAHSDLPFPDGSFDLVVSRHPLYVPWDEVARVLKPGGRYLSQDVGPGSVAELTEFMMGPPEPSPPEPSPPEPSPPGRPHRDPKWSVLGAERAGLTVTDLREFHGLMEFNDVAAVAVFLRKVIWIVPGFTVAAYRERLRALHEQIERDGPFRATSVRFLIEARQPYPTSPTPPKAPTGAP
jgi:SAM-dependent methyltransferase